MIYVTNVFVNENLKVVVLRPLTNRKPVHGKRKAVTTIRRITVVNLDGRKEIGIGEKAFF